VKASKALVWEMVANATEQPLDARDKGRWHDADREFVTVLKPSDRTKGHGPRSGIEAAGVIRAQR